MNLKFSDPTYKFLKWFTMIVLPAASSLYFGLSGIWDLPNTEQVVGTYSLVITFLGTLLGISTKTYNNSDDKFDGDVQVSKDDGGRTIMGLALNQPPETFPDKQVLLFKVTHTDDIPEGFAE